MPRLIALDWDDQELRLAVAQQQGKELTLEALRSIPIGAVDGQPGEAVAGDLTGRLRRLVAEVRGRHSDSVASVRRAEVELRPLKLPPVPDEELPDMVRFQALREFSELAEDWPIDFYPINDGTSQEETTVLAAAISPARMAEFQRIVDAAELKLRRLVLRPCAAAALVPLAGGVTEAEVQLMADDFGSAIELTVLREKTAIFMRTVQPPATLDPTGPERVNYLAGEIRRTILAVRNQLGGHPVERVVLFGSGDAHENLRQRLQERLQLEVHAIDPLSAFRLSSDLRRDPPATTGRFAAALGMLLEQSQQQRPAVDFLHPRKVAPLQSRRRLFAGIGGGVGLLALCLFAAFWWYLKSLDGEILSLQKDLQQLAPKVKTAEQRVSEAGAVREWTRGDINWLEQLRYVSEQLPPSDQARVDEWRAVVTANGDGNLVLEGLVDEQSTIAQIERQLRGEDDRRRIRGEGGTFEFQDEKYPWRFRETMTIVTADPKAREAASRAATPPRTRTLQQGTQQ